MRPRLQAGRGQPSIVELDDDGQEIDVNDDEYEDEDEAEVIDGEEEDDDEDEVRVFTFTAQVFLLSFLQTLGPPSSPCALTTPSPTTCSLPRLTLVRV